MKSILKSIVTFILIASSSAWAQNDSTALFEKQWQEAHKALATDVQLQLKKFMDQEAQAKQSGKNLQALAAELANEFSDQLPSTSVGQRRRFEAIKTLNNLLTPNQIMRTSLQTSVAVSPNAADKEKLHKLESEVEFVKGFTAVLRKTMSSPPKKK